MTNEEAIKRTEWCISKNKEYIQKTIERVVQRVISNLCGGSLSQINENPEEEEEEWRKEN